MTDRFITGRLQTNASDLVKTFGASVSFDRRLAQFDIEGSIAHTTMLAQTKIITHKEGEIIISGLNQVLQEIKSATFEWSIDLEDVHMNIENALVKKIGTVGKKLHTGRSRNDQVATDIRLWLRFEITQIQKILSQLINNLLNLAEKEATTIIPGFTHLQVAQPITFGHHILAWVAMLQRDTDRLNQCLERVNVMPLGAAALAGTTFPIDRNLTCELLNFSKPCANSLDGVSDRDFAIEFLADCSILIMHLSRFSEEIILWTSAQFNFINLPDSFCTGSSIMPQKKNPDVAELVRGKTGRIYGHLMSLLTIMKSQPLAYNKDNQEDKEPLFDTVDTIKSCIQVYTEMVKTIEVNQTTTTKACEIGFATATDLADYLVRKGETFRDAHNIVGNVVAFAIANNLLLADLSLEQLRQFSTKITQDVFVVLTLDGAVAARDHLGGTAPKQVLQAIKNIKNNG